MSFFAQCPDIGACQGAFQNDANVQSNPDFIGTVHYGGHSKKRHTYVPCCEATLSSVKTTSPSPFLPYRGPRYSYQL